MFEAVGARLASRDERTFLVLVTGNVLVAGTLRLLAPLLPAIIDGFAISVAEAGVAVTGMWVVYSTVQYPGGRLADALTRETVLVAALAVLAVSLLTVLVAGSFLGFVVGTVVLGVGGALYPPAAYAKTADLFADDRGERFGILGASINVGGVGAAALATAVLATATWRVAFLPLLGVAGVVLLTIHRGDREPYRFERVDLDPRATLARLLGDGRLRWLLVAVTLFTFVWQAVVTLLPTFLQLGKGYPQPFASGAFGTLFAVSIVASPLAGRAGDRHGHRQVALLAATVGGCGLVLVTASSSLLTAGVGVLAIACGFGPYLAVVEAYLVDLFPADSTGGDFGAGRALYVGLGSFGPALIGGLVDVVGYEPAFWSLLGVLSLSVCIVGLQVFTDAFS